MPLPTDGSGSLTITVSGGSFGEARVKTATYTVGTNVKVDFTPGSGSAVPAIQVAQVAIKAVIKNASADGSRVGVMTVSRTGAGNTD